jgi:hypothetical protein
MKLVLEISHLKYTTPATVSRASILFINDMDVGFMTYAHSWIDKRTKGNEKSQLTVALNNYVPRTIEVIYAQIKHIVPLPDVVMAVTPCRLLINCWQSRMVQRMQRRRFTNYTLLLRLFRRLEVFAIIEIVIIGRSSVRYADQSGETLHFRSRGQFSMTILVRTRRSFFHGRKSARRSSTLRGEVPGTPLSLR